MNPLTNTKNITKLNAREISLGVSQNASWHNQYKDSAWIFIGGLPYDLTEGDVLSVFSQFGEVVNINLVRDRKTGKQKGFCFLCYEDQRSTILAVDNLNGIKIIGRTIRVDHVASYKAPKERDDYDDVTKSLHKEGCAPKMPVETKLDSVESSEEETKVKGQELKKVKKKKKKRQKEKKDKKERRSSSSESSGVPLVKGEKQDPGYDKYEHTLRAHDRERRVERQSDDWKNKASLHSGLERNDIQRARHHSHSSERENAYRDHRGNVQQDRYYDQRVRMRQRSRSLERNHRDRSYDRRDRTIQHSRSSDRESSCREYRRGNEYRDKERQYSSSDRDCADKGRHISQRENKRRSRDKLVQKSEYRRRARSTSSASSGSPRRTGRKRH